MMLEDAFEGKKKLKFLIRRFTEIKEKRNAPAGQDTSAPSEQITNAPDPQESSAPEPSASVQPTETATEAPTPTPSATDDPSIKKMLVKLILSEDGKTVVGVEDKYKCYVGYTKYAIIPDGVTSIGDQAFSNCRTLTSITIPDSVTSIGNSAFKDSQDLTSILLPDGVTSIGDQAFSDCNSLTTISIPDTVTSIGNNAFENCYVTTENATNDSEFDLTEYGLTLIDSDTDGFCIRGNELVYYRYKDAETVTIPNGITSIGYGAFEGCVKLTTISIPDGVTSIGENAFWNVPHIEYHGSASGEPWGAKSMN